MKRYVRRTSCTNVETVATYELYDINRHKLENLLHRILAPGEPSMTITGPFGNKLSPREWFIVPLNVISEIVERIKDGTITNYRYDPGRAELVPVVEEPS